MVRQLSVLALAEFVLGLAALAVWAEAPVQSSPAQPTPGPGMSQMKAAPTRVREALSERYQRSYMEIQREPVGRVFGRGAVLVLQADEIPARPLRLEQLKWLNGRSPRFHVRDFASVEVGEDGRLTARPASLTLTKGTRLVVLDLTVDDDRVRLFTHTLDPVHRKDGGAVYGCTEFVFRFRPEVLERGDLGTIESRMDEWVPLGDRR